MPIFLAFTLLFAVYLHYQIRKTDRLKAENENIVEKESKANFTRKADISSLDYIKIPLETLPFHKTYDVTKDTNTTLQDEILACSKAIISMKDLKIINLTGISNTDLKLKYGVANLPFLMQYDENFSKLARTLSKWGRLLYEAKEYADAKLVLEFAVSLKCDIEDIFIILGKIYKIEKNMPALLSLKTQLDCFDEGRRANLLQKLDNL